MKTPYLEYDDSDQCCDECGCYHGHHPWCEGINDW